MRFGVQGVAFVVPRMLELFWQPALCAIVLTGAVFFVLWFLQRNKPVAQAQYRGQEDLVKELICHYETLLHERINFFLVAESLFFAAIASIWNSTSHLKLGLSVLACLYTMLLWHPMVKLHRQLEFLAAILRASTEKSVYKDFLDVGRGPHSWQIYFWVIPCLTLFAWCLLIARQLNS